ncbi:nicotinate-nucleotide adenylyltransferase [filamentous cyanobacterium LEGE 11480]|uniref:nicotinate-nucleotide adenylyltransferase n=1 Tax=Romeriopsis navalis LEGE 11480 TaxID=2777977 RepID=A0A928VN81_9CYAN|nr:nicotinate-nucleotide adenylyltransferase [Romeriopsis navalis]MBE9029605.1 nicotinate-nucleotide adenylyltransferase [Romeriopsis navalis LEGE 11480]
MTNIALFGTSADPPTIGHAAILKYLTENFDHVAVWAAENPFKRQRTPLSQRHQMLQLLIDDHQIDPDRIAVHPELSHARTWLTLEQAQQTWPDAQFTLVVGADLVQQITHWYRAKDLLQAVSLLVIPRQGYELQAVDLEPIRRLGTRVQIAQITPPKAASSEYRKQGKRPSPYLTPQIQAYIEREQLYAWQTDKTEKAAVHP